MINYTDLTRRAWKAYSRSGGWDQPSGESGKPYMATNGRLYLPLYNGSLMLAVYAVGSRGSLRRLKRWPKEISQKFAAA